MLGGKDTGQHSNEVAPMFRRYSAEEMARPVGNLAFLVDGLLVHPTYGQIAGPQKAMKSYVAMAIAMGVSSGAPVMGYFTVPQPMPVVYYCGEGGERTFRRRLQRMASDSNVDLASLDLEASFETAPIPSPIFMNSLERDLAEVEPGLVVVDPYYAYHGGQSRGSNLYEEGGLLSSLSSACTAAGSSLLLVHHFNRTGNGSGLQRITQSGSAEWADSWILLDHRQPPQVASGQFFLQMDVGSRQWSGCNLNVDLRTGTFDPATGTHRGQIAWTVRRSDARG